MVWGVMYSQLALNAASLGGRFTASLLRVAGVWLPQIALGYLHSTQVQRIVPGSLVLPLVSYLQGLAARNRALPIL